MNERQKTQFIGRLISLDKQYKRRKIPVVDRLSEAFKDTKPSSAESNHDETGRKIIIENWYQAHHYEIGEHLKPSQISLNDMEITLENPITKKGFVCFFDILGVKWFNSSQTVNLVKDIQRLAHVSYHLALKTHKGLTKPEISFFGDNIVLSWEVLEEDNKFSILGEIGAYTRFFIFRCLKEKYLMRGAISYGEFITSESHILGEAIYQSVAVEASLNWFGVVLAPNAEIIFEEEINRPENENLWARVMGLDELCNYPEEWFVQYDVEIKSKNGSIKRQTMYVSAWPFPELLWSRNHNLELSNVTKRLNNLVDGLTLHGDGPRKVKNGLDFHNWYLVNILPKFPNNFYRFSSGTLSIPRS